MMSKGKVAVLCLSHFKGGMELDAVKETKLFRKYGIDAILVCRADTFLEDVAREQGVPFVSIAFKRKLSLPLIQGLRSVIKDEDIDTLVFFGASEIKSIFFSVLGKNCRVIVRHGTTKSSSKKDPIHRLFYSCVSDFVGISEHLSKNALKILPSRPDNTHTIYNSLEQDFFTVNKQAPRTFLHVGRVDEGKGVFDAIQALGKAKIPQEYKKLTFVGHVESEDTKEEMMELAKKCHVEVSFEGFRSIVSSYYQQNSFFLFPSHGEGLGNVILEALSNGMSCITYDNTVFPELRNLGLEGFYMAKDRDTDMLAVEVESAFKQRDSVDLDKNEKILSTYFSSLVHVQSWKKVLYKEG
ncbi:glycosyltransferase family 4 protein [Grimontia kaedaensis]|uniref:Glycosyltransferase family 4 protein n=1 Tax=Grimontia kaedaensis TaxID=2872157 RepID=A0ABY4WTK2_9GAMM|nr:glycosyltransferase family 4 protein [Grimontia kaedaensis]USH02600.1 glycosyltransferase family 4 protein [Grimontia kaedaensis]